MHWEEAHPVPGLEAFGRADPVAVRSQAAFLLVLARQGRSDDSRPDEIAADLEDEESLEVPNLGDAAAAGLAVARMQWSERLGADSAALPPVEDGAIADSAKALYDSPSADAAVGLIQACLGAPDPLVRVAAAAADLDLSFQVEDLVLATDRMSVPAGWMYTHDLLIRAAAAGHRATADRPDRSFPSSRLLLPGRATEVLIRGAGSQDELVRDVAVSALEGARFHVENRTASGPERQEPPDHSEQRRTGSPSAPNDRPERRFSIVVHGTLATGWWKRGRAFPMYLKQQVASNLYAGSQPFYWSGAYNHRARALGAGDLAVWANNHGPLDHVFAHSHGGNLAMLASQRGVYMENLVLLSCPVHTRYAPDFGRIRKAVSVRARLDLVILVDGGRQRFRDRRIREHVLPLWFTHKATRQPDVWRRYKIAAML